MTNVIKEVARHFLMEGDVVDVNSHVNGLVNKTFMVETQKDDKKFQYVIQRINTYVFTCPERLMDNIVRVTDHIKKQAKDNKTLSVVFTKEGKSYYVHDGSFYRCYQYLAHSKNYNRLKNLQQFKEVGRAIGVFQKQLEDFSAQVLYPIIPNFHNTPLRYQTLLNTIETANPERKEEVKAELLFVKEAREELEIIQNALEHGDLPIRVAHNDTKLNNVMFDETTERALCLIDLDTVMPGTILFDYGDALRVGASTTDEDDAMFVNVQFDIKKFIAFTLGYLEQANERLTEMEFKLLADSVYIITMECGIRFLTDYLMNDKYFLIHYPTHNLTRARNQFCLANDIKQKLPIMKEIISSIRYRLNNDT